MPAGLMCMRPEADAVDFTPGANRFIVCKTVGVNAYGVKYEMGDELPEGVLNARAMREIYDTPLRLIETFEYALTDDALVEAMMRRAPVASDDDEKEEEKVPVATASEAPVGAVTDDHKDHKRPHKGNKRKP